MADSELLARLLPNDASRQPDAPAVVDALVHETVRLGASDVHLLPTDRGLQVQWRVDGVLGPPAWLPREIAANVIARLKVLAGLLTYETQTPQEGQFIGGPDDAAQLRVSTFPTLFGEKIVLRLLSTGDESLMHLADLHLPAEAQRMLSQAIAHTSGMVLLVGPAGSGKTTTAYAVLREIARQSAGRRSIATLEDPIEVVLPGVAQAQVARHVGFDLATGLKTLVRQDPEVIMIGEVRDAETARVAYQAALTGQLVVSTFHATDAATAIVRLLDMGIPAYMIRGATRAIVAQRLVRTLCDCRNSAGPACELCTGSGYRGRRVIAEGVDLGHHEASRVVVDGVERRTLASAFDADGMAGLRDQAMALVELGVTDVAEIDRVLGVLDSDIR